MDICTLISDTQYLLLDIWLSDYLMLNICYSISNNWYMILDKLIVESSNWYIMLDIWYLISGKYNSMDNMHLAICYLLPLTCRLLFAVCYLLSDSFFVMLVTETYYCACKKKDFFFCFCSATRSCYNAIVSLLGLIFDCYNTNTISPC